MAQSFTDFLVELSEKGDQDVLRRIPGYLDQHLAPSGNVTLERQRLAVEFQEKAPPTELSRQIFEMILERPAKP